MQQGIVWVVVVILVVVTIASAMRAVRESGWEAALNGANRNIFRVLPTPHPKRGGRGDSVSPSGWQGRTPSPVSSLSHANPQ